MYNIILAGVGGQGIVLASKIISTAAQISGKSVVSSETIGMAQRGGSVVSHIRIFDGKTVCSPLVPQKQADVVIAFELAEGARMLPYLKDGGKMVVSKGIIEPTMKYEYNTVALEKFLSENVAGLKLVDAMQACEEIGSFQVLNTVLLGSSMEFLKVENIEQAMAEKIKPQFLEINKLAFAKGEML